MLLLSFLVAQMVVWIANQILGTAASRSGSSSNMTFSSLGSSILSAGQFAERRSGARDQVDAADYAAQCEPCIRREGPEGRTDTSKQACVCQDEASIKDA